MRLLAALLLALVAGAGAWSEGDMVRVGVYTGDFPFAYSEDGEITGYGPELARAVCSYAGVECELVPMTLLDDRIASLQNGTVDVLFASLAVTPERAELVDFLHPFYDSSDLALVALDTQAEELEAGGAWAAIRGQTVCTVAGYFGIEHAQKFGPVIVEVPDTDAVADKLVAGDCVAALDGGAAVNLRQSAAERHNASLVVVPSGESVAPTPGGAAVAKGQGSSELALRLTGGLVAAMSRGNDSDVLRLEEEFAIANGVPPNPVLRRLVETVSYLVPV